MFFSLVGCKLKKMRSIKDTLNVVKMPGIDIKLKVGRWYKITTNNSVDGNYFWVINFYGLNGVIKDNNWDDDIIFHKGKAYAYYSFNDIRTYGLSSDYEGLCHLHEIISIEMIELSDIGINILD